MKKILFMLTICTVAVLWTGCTGNAVYLKSDQAIKATNPDNISVYSATEMSRKFEVIGYVSTYSTDANREGDKLRDNLRAQAAKYGANAIIAFKLNIGMGGGGGAQGVAIRFTE